MSQNASTEPWVHSNKLSLLKLTTGLQLMYLCTEQSAWAAKVPIRASTSPRLATGSSYS